MTEIEARRVTVTGVVQGVGFRPFVYRVAHEQSLTGWVLNDTDGVRAHVEGAPESIDRFVAAMRDDAPAAARVDRVTADRVRPERHPAFEIRRSENVGAPTTRISPDLCVCEDCLAEMADPSDPRHGYEYINCTNCGPRYSIIRSLPYDRPRTTMVDWPLCEACQREYEDPLDRRYHAQPVACPKCGPRYYLSRSGESLARGSGAIEAAAGMLADGSILAVKGLGGYHLACDASNPTAVGALRDRKFRKEKPFAVMCRDTQSASELAELTDVHRELLESTARPILLAPVRRVLGGVHPGVNEIGLMLPYTPLHHLLFEAGAPGTLVLTSANRSSEPIAYRDEDALDRLDGIADAFLIGERPIQRRVDDSVVSVRGGRPSIIRRARGYAPGSLATLRSDRPILAVGADLKNSVALAVGGELFVSQHIGDLDEYETEQSFRETIDDLLSMYEVDANELVVAHDLHPQYVSTRIAERIPCAERVRVQHHEAHIASVMLELGEPGTRVVGLAMDGTGYGHDDTIWGGEVLLGSIEAGFRRVDSLSPVSMPGGDGAARNPVQAAAAYLTDIDPALMERGPFGFSERFRQARGMIERGTNCINTSSAGRLFDAIAAICGFTRAITFEGQAAIWLENLAQSRGGSGTAGAPPSALQAPGFAARAVQRRLRGVPAPEVAFAFHDELANALARVTRDIATRESIDTVALSGGVWQNTLLWERFCTALPSGIRVLTNAAVPCNDGGISAGQAALASAAR